MSCRSCGQTFPIIRPGLPTIYAFGPFPGWEDVDYDLEKNNGNIQEEPTYSDTGS